MSINTLVGRFGGFAGTGAGGKLINITSAPPAVSTPYVVDFETVSEYNMTANTAGSFIVPGVWTFTVIGGSFNTNLEGVGGGGFGGGGSKAGDPAEAGYPGAATTFVGPGLSMTAGAGTGGAGSPGGTGSPGGGGSASGGDTNTPGNPAAGGGPGVAGSSGATVAPSYFTPLGQNGAGQGGDAGQPDSPTGPPAPAGGGGGGGSGAYVSKNETLIAGGTYTFTVGAEGNKPYPTPTSAANPGGVKITVI